ncbi:unnamed protein product [Thelazia callipaeda]|uniref:G_PROTEIN_RECEP_F1_2 domain-containing protein n=1 Tax=Thelazia callipaeda TaxID=103827 RepID=A0A0N5DB35_THECL|nr:unnamed protein product [Thelazia callipaeda]
MVTAVKIYATAEIVLSVHISVSNLIVLWLYLGSQHLRTITNTYIFFLALTDFLIGSIGIPLTVYSVLTRAPHSFLPCLAIHSTLCTLCTISIFHLLAIALDKYISICCKSQIMKQSHRYQRAIVLIAGAWISGALVLMVQLLWFSDFRQSYDRFSGECYFTEVVDYRYLVYVIFFGTIVLPTFIIIYCYARIYSYIQDEEYRIKFLLRDRERERRVRSRRKLISTMSLLVSTYGICWYPLHTLNTINLFFPELRSYPNITLSAVVLSHVSCAVNPLIYAYGIPGFKQALQAICKHHTDESYRPARRNHGLSSFCYSKQVAHQKTSTTSFQYLETLSPKYSTASARKNRNRKSKAQRKITEPDDYMILRQTIRQSFNMYVKSVT